jgi:glutamate/tyrosine decarboxylase-like PLP-dependent enzyme
MSGATPAVATIEQLALDWMVDVLNLPAGTGGGFVTGATVANFSALGAARNEVLRRHGWDARADGVFGAPEVTVAVGEEAHPTLMKSLGMLGLGQRRVVTMEVDNQGRIRADKLPKLDGPVIFCTQAGNVNTGAFDPIAAVCEHAAKLDAWVHVDGAFGLWAAASDEFRHLCAGMENADSWATDAHKWLNVPYDCGIAFVRDPQTLRAVMAIEADYLITEHDIRNPSDFTPELSRRARGIEVWAALRTLGKSGLADLINRCCHHATRFAEELNNAGFDIINDVVLNQVLVSFGSPERTLKIVEAIQEEGTCWCGVTVWQGKTAMRISVSNWSTTEADVDRSLLAIVAIAKRDRL